MQAEMLVPQSESIYEPGKRLLKMNKDTITPDKNSQGSVFQSSNIDTGCPISLQ